MVWVLIVTLLGGPSGPVVVDKDTCQGVAQAVAEGRLIMMQQPDGSGALVLAAQCRAEVVL